ncbi:ribonuclease H-like domain-containing protein [Candidatus Woesearchaeota archaeon]|nr:ribonuclease H-like domain-containing protein [Candidatus Woesearchaeota archaeon]
MLQSTFSFLPDITGAKEQRLWKQGITSWDKFLTTISIKGITAEKKREYDLLIQRAKQAILEDNVSFFKNMQQKEMWRLYPSFKERVVYLDIEISNNKKEIMLVGLSDGYETKTFVQGINLDREAIIKALSKNILLITFNGSSHDLPVLERYCKTAFNCPHIDLKHCCARLNWTGGLKEVEKKLNLRRPEHLHGSPSDAWRAFLASRDKGYLDLIIQYNEEDVINLKPIMEKSYQELEKGYKIKFFF